VKFGKYVTGSVVKMPEKFGFNRGIFGWFGHFIEHVTCGELGFRGNDHLRYEKPPEGARNMQGCLGTHRNTYGHLASLDFTGIWN
jgi:hypothetical protein